MSVLLNGTGVSRGVAIGAAHIMRQGPPEPLQRSIEDEALEAEIRRFHQALAEAQRQLRQIRERIPTQAPTDVAAFIDTHLLMLGDGLLCEAPVELIRRHRCNAEWALKLQRDSLVSVFDEMQDTYLRTRRDDLDHVIQRIQRILLNLDSEAPCAQRLKGHIIICDDLTPADTLLFDHAHVAGFVTEYGGPYSHTAILARNLGLPAVVGLHDARGLIHEHERLIIDGTEGMVVAEANTCMLKKARAHQRAERQQRQALERLRDIPAQTLDRQRITLMVNTESSAEIPGLLQAGVDGVGLYRTEFLFLNRDRPPDEEEQRAFYTEMVQALGGRPAVIRTLDLGADKHGRFSLDAPLSPNPALGLRAIRLCLKDPGLFATQLRAILRASAFGQVHILLPMLASIQELRRIKVQLNQARHTLEQRAQAYDTDIRIGGMIETPAAALCAAHFAAELDFLSIGTNDLIQYTLAVDRTDEQVTDLFDPLHPAVLALIRRTLVAGRRAGIPVALCGEMASDPRYTRLLLGLGLREFSMQPASLLEVKRVISMSRIQELTQAALHMLKLRTPQEASRALQALNQDLTLH